MRPAEVLARLYQAGVAAAQPGPAVARALAADPPASPVHIIALGKAAPAMARAACEALRRIDIIPAGGVAVGVAPPTEPLDPTIRSITGDHPVPGARSAKAAAAIADAASNVTPSATALILLSGGGSSLGAAPIPGITARDLAELNRVLLGSGLDIVAMNRVRKRFLRWGGGRLAAALAPATVRCLILSDVIGNDPGSIASGPCTADDDSSAEIVTLLQGARVWGRVPEAIRSVLSDKAGDPTLQPPRSSDPAFARVRTEIIGDNSLALTGAAQAARGLATDVTVVQRPLGGEAALAGEMIADALAAQPDGSCMIWGGETTVTLNTSSSGSGGRCQELALAAAQRLDGNRRVALLAAGSDGRDGPTDAAGAIVDGATWERMRRAGRDPARDLSRHDSHAALNAAGALLRTGPTGTNVVDIVIGLVGDAPAG